MTEPKQPAVVKRETRRERPPVGGLRDILTIANMDKNFEYRWVNASKPGRVEWLKERGWEEVDKEGHEVGQRTVDTPTNVGSKLTRFGGHGVTLLAMRIPKEWFDEDQARKQEMVDALEETMQREVNSGSIPGSNQPGYIPTGGGLQVTRRR